MVDARRFSLTPQLDIQQILIEAKIRWLRPSEICEILRNYQKFSLTPDPPYQPSGGSLFLFDRKALRYFRKDGHRWRKKKDGKTVREAHEKLKSGSVDVLHCYYAHGEDTENFQRRSYWMLDGQLEHIVLVHYRDVTEGSRSSVSHLSNTDPETTDNRHGALSGSAVCSAHLGSAFDVRAGNGSSPSTVPTPSSEFDDADSGDLFGGASFTDSEPYSRFQIASLPGHDMVETDDGGCTTFSHPRKSGMSDSSLDSSFSPFFVNQVAPQSHLLSREQQKIRGCAQPSGLFGATCFTQHNTATPWPEVLCLDQKPTEWQEENIPFEQTNCGEARTITRRIGDTLRAGLGVRECVRDAGSSLLVDTYSPSFRRDESTLLQVKGESSMNVHSPYSDIGMEDNSTSRYEALNKNRLYPSQEPEVSRAAKNALRSNAHTQELGELKKLDSFGRWMDKEIGKDCDDSLMGSESCDYWTSLNTPSVEKDVSSLSHHMQLDNDSLGPSLSQEQLFSILDFSPDWAYSGIGTKLLITGTFLGDVEPNTIKWGCMFGEQEVSAEVLTTKVIRCEAPTHTPGRVPFYVTCSNRLACSEVREFEYRENNSGELFSLSPKSEPEEVQLQVRFAKMLSLRADTKKLICYARNCQKCLQKKSFFSLLTDGAHEWDKIEKDSKVFREHHINHRNRLLEKTLQEMLYHWLVRKVHEEGKGPHTFDEEGQGAIHLAASLGYQWAMGPIVAAGVHPSFRDARGRTALHWAAYFGREETVVALVKLGAAPGAVEDPTPTFPGGTTAADLASDRGHKGIAGYLAEAALTSHLSSLALREHMLESALVTADKAVETVKVQNNFCLDGGKADQLSLRGSLAAMRNSALAAAQIQFAFRSHSFRQRQSRDGICENNDIGDNALLLSFLRNMAQKNSHFSDSLHVSAVKIQRKYRGWKAHKEFLKFRDRIVKIQAHVRGHQVRKQYKKVVWSVSIVEKAILRWRRKRSGLRGFRSEKAGVVEQEIGETDEYEFLRHGRKQKVAAVEKALGRVQSMVRSSKARDQYMRLVAISHESQFASKSLQPPQTYLCWSLSTLWICFLESWYSAMQVQECDPLVQRSKLECFSASGGETARSEDAHPMVQPAES